MSSGAYPEQSLSAQVPLHGFAKLPNAVLFDRELSSGALRLYAVLVHHARQRGECWPRQETLAAELSVSDRMVRTYIGKLVARGHLDVRRGGDGEPNTYVLLASRPEAHFRSDGVQIGSRLPPQTGSRLPVHTTKKKEGKKKFSSNSKNADLVIADLLPAQLLAAFNEEFGTDFRDRSYADAIARVVAARPDVDLERHRMAMRNTRLSKWFKGSPAPTLIYASVRAFERALNLPDQPDDGVFDHGYSEVGLWRDTDDEDDVDDLDRYLRA